MSTKKSSRKSTSESYDDKVCDVYCNLYAESFVDASDEVKAFLAFTELKTTTFNDSFFAFHALSKEAKDEYLSIQVKRFFRARSLVA
jgi:hypothetical protein